MESIRKGITLPSREGSLAEVRELLWGALKNVRLPEERKEIICRSVEETVESLARYSDFKGYRHDISLSVDVDEKRFRAIISDSRTDFSSRGVLSDAQVAEEKPFRMGMTLARQVMDEISYTYKKGDRSELELVHSL